MTGRSIAPPPRAITASMEAEPLGPEPTGEDRLLLLFAYLGPLAFVSLIASRRVFVRWHAKQGLVLFVAGIVGYLVTRALYVALIRFLPPMFGELFWGVVGLTLFGLAIAAVVCIVRAFEGERFKLPFLADLADKL